MSHENIFTFPNIEHIHKILIQNPNGLTFNEILSKSKHIKENDCVLLIDTLLNCDEIYILSENQYYSIYTSISELNSNIKNIIFRKPDVNKCKYSTKQQSTIDKTNDKKRKISPNIQEQHRGKKIKLSDSEVKLMIDNTEEESTLSNQEDHCLVVVFGKIPMDNHAWLIKRETFTEEEWKIIEDLATNKNFDINKKKILLQKWKDIQSRFPKSIDINSSKIIHKNINGCYIF